VAKFKLDSFVKKMHVTRYRAIYLDFLWASDSPALQTCKCGPQIRS